MPFGKLTWERDPGTPAAEACRKMGVSEATYFHRKQRYGGLAASELRKMRQFGGGNLKLKRLAADLSLDKADHPVVHDRYERTPELCGDAV